MQNNYKCDVCPATFSHDEAIAAAIPEPKGFQVHTARALIKDGVRHLLKCPKCGRMHFFGFDTAEPQKPANQQLANENSGSQDGPAR